jgi:hypothetical protein
MANTKQTAPEFAKKFASLIKDQLGITRRKLATTIDMDAAAVNRLCTTGKGSEENICRILKHMNLKPRRILEILTDRRAELCTGEARKMWKNFRYAFPNDREYMAELCPFPLERVCACTRAGISVQHVIDLARKLKIRQVENLTELKQLQIIQLYCHGSG